MTQNKKLIVVVIGAGAIGAVILGLVGSLNAFSTPQETFVIGPTNADQPPETEAKIQSILGNDPEAINDISARQTAIDIISTQSTGDMAKLIIHSDSYWSAVTLGSNSVQESIDGELSQSIDFECKQGGIFSHVVQLKSDVGALAVYVAQDGHILKEGGTVADYGIVSLAGACA